MAKDEEEEEEGKEEEEEEEEERGFCCFLFGALCWSPSFLSLEKEKKIEGRRADPDILMSGYDRKAVIKRHSEVGSTRMQESRSRLTHGRLRPRGRHKVPLTSRFDYVLAEPS